MSLSVDSSDVVWVESKLIGGIKRQLTSSWNREHLQFFKNITNIRKIPIIN